MTRNKIFAPSVFLALGIGLLVAGCSGTSDPDNPGKPDTNVAKQDGSISPDKAVVKPDAAPLTSLKVAAVQYGAGSYSTGCSTNLCSLTYHVTEAAKQGALVVVTPEYAMGYGTSMANPEAAPAIGDTPATDSRWKAGSLLKVFSKLADDLNITLVFSVVLSDSKSMYNALVAVDKDGKVVARHYKFELFGNESKQLTPGPDVNSSFFDTPAGKAGLMICADAQCMVTNLQPSPNCTNHAIKLIKDYFLIKKPAVVFFAAAWTVGSGVWGSINVQKDVAKDAQVWLVAANTTSGAGKGGGIYKPTGEAVKSVVSSTPSIVYAELPLKK